MKNTISKISVLTLAFIIAIMSFAACADKKQPGMTKEYFENNKTEVIMNSLDYSKFSDFSILNAEDYESVEFSMDIPDSNMNFLMSANSDTKNSKGDLGIVLGADGKQFDLSAYYDSKKFALASNAFLGESVSYGITFDSLKNTIEKFENSALFSMLGIEKGMLTELCNQYGITDEYIKGIVDAYKKYSPATLTIDDMIEEVFALYESSYGEVMEETVEVNGETYDALSVEIICDKQLVANVFDWYIGYMEKSLQENEKLLVAFIPEPFKEELLPEVSEDYSQSLEEVKAELSAVLDSMEISGSSKIYIDRKTGKYLMEKDDVSITVDGETVKVVAEQYMTANGTIFDGTVTVNGETMDISGSMTESTDETGTKYVFDFVVGNGENTAVSLNLGLDYANADGSYELYLDMTSEDEKLKMSANGKYTESADEFEFTVDSFMFDDGYDSVNADLNLIYKASKKADVKQPEGYTEISQMSQNDLFGVLGRIGVAGSELSSLFESSTPEPDFYDEYTYYYE